MDHIFGEEKKNNFHLILSRDTLNFNKKIGFLENLGDLWFGSKFQKLLNFIILG